VITYILLIRGINVGGKNKVSMTHLKQYLEKDGFSYVMSYIASGNLILASDKQPASIQASVENCLSQHFALDSKLVKVLVLSKEQLERIVKGKPEGFGEKPETYYSDVIFLMDIDIDTALSVFHPKEGVDKIWPGNGVVYSQRLGAMRTKSRLNKIVGTPPYQSMTIRSWNTTTKLLALAKQYETQA